VIVEGNAGNVQREARRLAAPAVEVEIRQLELSHGGLLGV